MIKRSTLLVLSVLFFLIIGCEKGVDSDMECDLTFPAFEIQWERPNGNSVSDCLWFLNKIVYRSKVYYSIGNHCVDMAPFVAQCDGVNICEDRSRLCSRILEKGTSLGVVAVEIE